jgi:DNA-binding PadR family transcriptional regulator
VAIKKHWFHILLALAQGPAHGAEIRRRVKTNTEGSLELYPAMLYGSLDDLLEKELIRELDEEEVSSSDATPRSRYHDLTPRGREVLAAEAAAYKRVAEIALAHLGREGEATTDAGRWV